MVRAQKWQKDLEVYQDINTTFIIEGNVHDLQPWLYKDEDACEPVSLMKYLNLYLEGEGYEHILFYNRIDGFHNPYCIGNQVSDFLRKIADGTEKKSHCIGDATEIIRKAMTTKDRNRQPTAVIMDLANTIAISPDNLSDNEVEYFTRLMLASRVQTQARSKNGKPLTNLLFLIVEKVNDIPVWFYLNNPYVRTLTISRPDKDVRREVIAERFDNIDGAGGLKPEEYKKAVDEFVALTEGMTLVELTGVFRLCVQEKFNVRQIREAVKLFRFGETESHWDKLNSDKIRNAEKTLSQRVIGQKAAVQKVANVLSRAYLGLSGIQGGSPSRPRGVLFLAGPTGTGKTELAKGIAELVFGDESFVTRFDMSEYQQPHSDQKLLGAPPGYVGYGAGGQLTNAIKDRPFCVLLFDEIDKAHPSILDKFLQILEDGRLTDSAGETVYFSEALIVFTSNLGVVGRSQSTGISYQTVSPDMEYDEVRNSLLASIRNYFKFSIQRPELLNRIGDNIVVFNFIHEDAAAEILSQKLEAVIRNVQSEKGLTITISERFRSYLLERAAADLSNGGRGVSNMIETALVNPLADILLKEDLGKGDTLEIVSEPIEGEIPEYILTKCNK